MACTNISTVADLIYEEDETFSVVISSTQDRLIIAVNSSIVLIMDDDSEFILVFIIYQSKRTAFFLLFKGVVVSWQQSSYAAIEGSALSVCAVQPALTEKTFNVIVTAPPSEGLPKISFILENNLLLIVFVDFIIEDPVIVFPPTVSNQTRCTNVTIVFDAILEKEETFCLNMNSSDPDVIIGQSSMTTCIMIADNNSELQVLLHH